MTKLLYRYSEDYEWLIDCGTGEVLTEGHHLRALDIIMILAVIGNFDFEIEEVEN